MKYGEPAGLFKVFSGQQIPQNLFDSESLSRLYFQRILTDTIVGDIALCGSIACVVVGIVKTRGSIRSGFILMAILQAAWLVYTFQFRNDPWNI